MAIIKPLHRGLTRQLVDHLLNDEDIAAPTAPPVYTPVLTTIVVTPPSRPSIVPGDLVQMVATAFDQMNNQMADPAYIWASSTPAVATIDATGLLTSVAVGSTTVTASFGGKTGSATVTVTAAAAPPTTGVLGVWDFAAGSMAASGVATGITLGDLTRNASASATFTVTTTSPGTSSDPVLSIDSSSTGTSHAFTNGRYCTFTVTVASGKVLSLTSLTVKAARAGTSTNRGFGLRSSLDSFAANLSDFTVTESGTTLALKTTDLSGAAFQNLAAGTYTFRLAVWTNGAGLPIRFDDLTLNGTVTDGTGGGDPGGGDGGGGGTLTTGTDPVFTAEPGGYVISYNQQFTPAFINSIDGNGTGWGKGFSGDSITDQEALTCPWKPAGIPGIARLMLRAGTTAGVGNSPSGGFDAAVPYLPDPAPHRFQKSYSCTFFYISPNWINHPVETKMPPLTWPCGKFHVYPALVGSGGSASGTLSLDLVLQSMDWRTAGTAKRYSTGHPTINRGQWYKLQIHTWQPSDIITPSSDGRVVLYLNDTLIYDTGYTMPLAKHPPDASTYMYEYQMKMTYGGAGTITFSEDQWIAMAGLRVSGSLTL